MSKSRFLAVITLLLIGLTSISSVSGLKCYWCHANDVGFYNCDNSPGGEEQICKPEENACYRETHVMDSKKVVSEGCMKAEHMEVGCKDTTTIHTHYGEVKVNQCICKTDLCNGGAGGGKRVKRHGHHGSHVEDPESNGGNGSGDGNPDDGGESGDRDGASGLRPQLLIAVTSLAAVLIFSQ